MPLVLSRKLNQKIILVNGDTRIEIAVADIDRGKIRLAFTAPRSVQVWREELLEKTTAANGSGREA